MNANLGHGHVRSRPDGVKARCGGPGVCAECSREAAAVSADRPASAPDTRWPRNAEAVTFNAITHALGEQGEWVPLSARSHATEAVLTALDEIGALTYEPFVAGSGERDVIDMGWMSLPPEIQAEGERAASAGTPLRAEFHPVDLLDAGPEIGPAEAKLRGGRVLGRRGQEPTDG